MEHPAGGVVLAQTAAALLAGMARDAPCDGAGRDHEPLQTEQLGCVVHCVPPLSVR